eukprot:GHVU01102127.1.p1 GENE.GHVU01102127.1~~GHVU01102127.1.p1  ORF type:complete len:107 (+),score=6.25 GHVU01102127.1:29-349(+)
MIGGQGDPIVTAGFAAYDNEGSLRPFKFQRRNLREDDILITVICCGVCHTDIHKARSEWRDGQYPMVPGHEIVGRVADVGAAVSDVKRGDLVGVGVLVDACGACTP